MIFLVGYIIDATNIFCYKITGSIGDVLYLLIKKTYGIILCPIIAIYLWQLFYKRKILPKMKLLIKNPRRNEYKDYSLKLIELCYYFSLKLQYISAKNYKNYTAYSFNCLNEQGELTVFPLRFKILEYDFENALFQEVKGKVRHIFDYDTCIIEVYQDNITYFSETIYQTYKYLFYTDSSFFLDSRQNLIVYGEIDVLYSLLFSLILSTPHAEIYLYNYVLKYELELFSPKYVLYLQEIVKEMEHRYLHIFQCATSLEHYRLNAYNIPEYKNFHNIYLYVNQECSSTLNFIIENGHMVGIYVILFNADHDSIPLKLKCYTIYDAILSKHEYKKALSIPKFQIEEIHKIIQYNLS